MAAIFKMEDSLPMWGDEEAQWLIDNLDIEFEDTDGNNVMLRLTNLDLKRMWTNMPAEADEFHLYMLHRLDKMMAAAGTPPMLDLLVRW